MKSTADWFCFTEGAKADLKANGAARTGGLDSKIRNAKYD